MTNNKLQKLELTWIGKGEEPKLEPRILIEQPEYSYGNPSTENMLIHGDNLLALKALEQDYAGKIKCIYIDPPYNTGSAFSHYEDGLEHSLWLNLISNRIKILKNLLSNDGSIWINIDDNEGHYLKVVCDEIFGRNNFMCGIAWEKRYSPPPDTKDFGYIHDQILVYKKSDSFKRNLLPLTDDQSGRYKNPDDDPRGPWKAMDYTCRYNSIERPNLNYPIKQPNTGEEVWPKTTRVWAMSKDVTEKNLQENRIWWGAKGTNSVPALKNYFSEISQGMMPMSLWKHTLAGHNQEAKKEIKELFGDDIFDTPKPERLLMTVLTIATNPGDLVLDSFLGSGTTAAVANKMGRRWIGVELGEHAKTHCFTRMKQVVDGEQGGISKAVNWKGGGGFKFYTLAPSLLNQDKFGNWVISTEYNAQMLAAATAKQEGFRFNPHETLYWKQGISSENDYIFTTTQFITVETLDQIHDEMLPGESLLICCKSYQKECNGRFSSPSGRPGGASISIKKIPQMLLGRCEFGRDDYSLNIVNMPTEEQSEDLDYPVSETEIPVPKPAKKDKRSVQEINQTNRQTSLFD